MASNTARTLEWRKTSQLKPHPLNAKIYGPIVPTPEFLKSIEEHGVLSPPLITPGNLIIAGEQRWIGNKHCKREDIRCIVVRDVTDPLDIEEMLIVSNRQREKTNEMRAREAARLAEIVGARAKARQTEKLKKGAEIPVRKQVSSRETDDNCQGKTTDIVGESLGVSGPTADKLIEVGQALKEAEKAKDVETVEAIKEGLEKSVAAGHRAAKASKEPKEDDGEESADDVERCELGGIVLDSLIPVFKTRNLFRGWLIQVAKVQNSINEVAASPAGVFIPQELITALKKVHSMIKWGKPYTECPKCRRKPKKDCVVCEGHGWTTRDKWSRSRTEEDEAWGANR